MLKRITAFILIIALLAANFSSLFVYAGFELNKKYIVTALCVNRDKPVMMCNGKCYYEKKVKQSEEKEKSQEKTTQKTNFQEAVITRNITLTVPQLLLQKGESFEKSFRLPETSQAIFQPPC